MQWQTELTKQNSENENYEDGRKPKQNENGKRGKWTTQNQAWLPKNQTVQKKQDPLSVQDPRDTPQGREKI